MNYDKYTFRRREMISFLIAVTVLFLLIGKLFFGTFLAGGLCIVFFPFLWKKKKKQLLEKRKKQLVKEFKDLILSFGASLKAGYSIENAFLEACRDLTYLYDASADILQECKSMKRQMENHISLEALLNDLGERSRMTDIMDFAKVFATAKKRRSERHDCQYSRCDRSENRTARGNRCHADRKENGTADHASDPTFYHGIYFPDFPRLFYASVSKSNGYSDHVRLSPSLCHSLSVI